MSLLFSGGKLTQRILAENGIWFRNGVNTTTGLDTVKRMAGIRRSLTGTEVGTAFDGGDPGCPLKDGNATCTRELHDDELRSKVKDRTIINAARIERQATTGSEQ